MDSLKTIKSSEYTKVDESSCVTPNDITEMALAIAAAVTVLLKAIIKIKDVIIYLLGKAARPEL